MSIRFVAMITCSRRAATVTTMVTLLPSRGQQGTVPSPGSSGLNQTQNPPTLMFLVASKPSS